ncbi:DUF6249 domain-containing protein [Puia dinghuensis]|uniref:DUF6249 domain-containing protein n=1 Tax=Puia dinghuensis TaxID=1792502 RepID=A0A8J2UBH4_9BACT|nr:DUF6249 domain-containing protein [Puia dinghuensis]GGA91578.1 hypothetical protein GCM10011511_13660 [Puia dinghuensis]
MGPEQLVFVWLMLSSLGLFGVIFGWRYMRNRENMAMIEKGIDPNIKPERPRPAPFRNLKWGLLLVGAGVGLFFAYLLDNTLLYNIGHNFDKFENEHYVNGGNVSIYFALIAIGGGLGLIASYRIEKKELLDKQQDK